MAKQKKTKYTTGRNKVRNSILQWSIVAVVGGALLFLMVRTIARPPGEPAPIPMLTTTKDDVIGLTRMLGDVVLDSATRAKFPASLAPKLKGPDTLYEQRRWYDALNAMQGLFGKATAAESIALNAYMAVAFKDAASEDRAVVLFRKVLAKDPTPDGYGPWAAFNIGFLFQSRGFPDSAAAYYARARDMLSPSTGFLRAATLNNLGVAAENLKDLSAAQAMYAEATALLDTTVQSRELRTVRDNLARARKLMSAPKTN